MRIAAEEDRCELTVGGLRERLVHAGKPASQLSARVLAPGLRRLARHSLVQVKRGFEARDDELIVVTSLVEKILPPERIHEIEERMKGYVASRTVPPSADATGEVEVNSVEEEAEEETA